MKRTDKKDELPETFASYDEAGDFWDTHDSTDYQEHLVPVKATIRADHRHFEVEVDEDVLKALARLARSRRKAPSLVANELLRKELALA